MVENILVFIILGCALFYFALCIIDYFIKRGKKDEK